MTLTALSQAEARSLYAQMRRSGGTVESVRRLIADDGVLDRRDEEEARAWGFRQLVRRAFDRIVLVAETRKSVELLEKMNTRDRAKLAKGRAK